MMSMDSGLSWRTPGANSLRMTHRYRSAEHGNCWCRKMHGSRRETMKRGRRESVDP